MSLLKKTKTYPILCFVVCFLASLSSYAQVYQNKQLEAEAAAFIKNQITLNENAIIEINALPLDSKIKSRTCEAAPILSTHAKPPFNRQVTVRVKCEGVSGWTQFVQVRVEELFPIIVTTQNINKGELVTADLIKKEFKPKHFIRANHLQTKKLLIGSRSKRVLRTGMAINLQHICMVCKGDLVTIFAKTGTLTIKTTGFALQDGNVGEQIRVKNQKSGKTISARVQDVKSVAVNL